MENTDILIVGSGIAGLSLAIKINSLNPKLKITLITKSDAIESNTRYAQGGIAAVLDTINDSFENHINDTLKCGAGLCTKSIVEMVVRKAPERIKELVNLGVQFDKKPNGNIHLALEGGHVAPRVAHHKDKTGFEIETVLLNEVKTRKNITLISHQIVIDLITDNSGGNNQCVGVYVYEYLTNKIKIKTITAKTTVLATGGCGQVYHNTTNPLVATGDGYGMAFRAGAILENMRFVQFHPTALYQKNHNEVSFLISEAVRGFGAHVVDENENRFLFVYDKRGELATRDIVSAAIFEHMQAKKTDCVYLDLRHLNAKAFATNFPVINEKLNDLGYNISNDLIPIIPSAHYQSGGVKVNEKGQTNIENLYALGEVSCTGLHGANRLASNSLLEALVFAHEAAVNIVNTIDNVKQKSNLSIEKNNGNLVKFFDNNWIQKQTNLLKKNMSAATFQNDDYNYKKVLDFTEQIIDKVEVENKQNNYSLELLNLRSLATTAKIIVEDLIYSSKKKLKTHLILETI
jgi:L-aspartate oxidase